MARKTSKPTILRNLSPQEASDACLSGDVRLCVIVPVTGPHTGELRTSLANEYLRSCRTTPWTAKLHRLQSTSKPAVVAVEVTPEPAPVQPAQPAPAKRTSKARFATVNDVHGDGGSPGLVQVEIVPSQPAKPAKPASKRMPAPRKGEKWSAFAGRCRSAGFDFAAASVAWKARKPASKPAAKRTAKPASKRMSAEQVEQVTAKPAPRKLDKAVASQPSPAEDSANRKRARRAAQDAQVTSVVEEQRKAAERMSEMQAEMGELKVLAAAVLAKLS